MITLSSGLSSRQNACISNRAGRQWVGHPHSVPWYKQEVQLHLLWRWGSGVYMSDWGAASSILSLVAFAQKAHHVALSTGVQIVPLGRYWTGGWRRSPNPSPAGTRWREHRLPTPRLWAHSGRWIGWPTHQRRQSMPLRACASLGCSYAKFDERGFSGSDELGARRWN